MLHYKPYKVCERAYNLISVDWGDPQETFLVMFIEGDWTTSMMLDTAQKVNALVKSKPYPVHLLIDMHTAGIMPRDLFTFLPTIIRHRPKNAGKTVVISKNNVWHNLWQILQKAIHYIHEHDFLFVTDANDAYTLLRSGSDSTE